MTDHHRHRSLLPSSPAAMVAFGLSQAIVAPLASAHVVRHMARSAAKVGLSRLPPLGMAGAAIHLAVRAELLWLDLVVTASDRTARAVERSVIAPLRGRALWP